MQKGLKSSLSECLPRLGCNSERHLFAFLNERVSLLSESWERGCQIVLTNLFLTLESAGLHSDKKCNGPSKIFTEDKTRQIFTEEDRSDNCLVYFNFAVGQKCQTSRCQQALSTCSLVMQVMSKASNFLCS